MHAGAAQSAHGRSMICTMEPVPGWYVAACWLVAIACSVLAGYHYNVAEAPRWIAMFGAAGVAAAVLPSRRRALALVAVAVGVADGTWSGLELAQQWDAPVSELWHVGAVAAVAGWLLLASLVRALIRS